PGALGGFGRAWRPISSATGVVSERRSLERRLRSPDRAPQPPRLRPLETPLLRKELPKPPLGGAFLDRVDLVGALFHPMHARARIFALRGSQRCRSLWRSSVNSAFRRSRIRARSAFWRSRAVCRAVRQRWTARPVVVRRRSRAAAIISFSFASVSRAFAARS